MNKLALYCRAGFEKELAAEITEKAAEVGIYGFARVVDNSGYVIFECYQENEADRLAQEIQFKQLIFARQLVVVSDLLQDLATDDRISPIVAQYQQNSRVDFKQSTELWVETADTNEAKSLSTFCRKFTVPLRQQLRKCGWLNYREIYGSGVTLHILFISNDSCYVGYSYNNNHAPHFMGIPRLKFPNDAPSRSTLKLEEAILTFLSEKEEKQRMNSETKAVDLGACPGGWSYQLVKRGMFVYAVDHGKIAPSLMETGRVDHCPEDGFKFQPPKRTKIDWLVCDMVEQPMRITSLMSKWLTNGWCGEMIFNLKLPMKKRYQEVRLCQQKLHEDLSKAGLGFEIQAKHLYHDREEITLHVRIKSLNKQDRGTTWQICA
ncbi:23S rRNA (cytidine(2498)-2'-O)-methyltransferase RlmM [Testudinibacter aquarius]|uniref:Ribosomal RNA large subunit methyltransferase M n=1 Tax=Testudinibacter aquarius TaxID=1524974 RepID=A0A4R3Y5H8_9PAST|nr:23S rRNA (cytidine(2498)-2'-O)-methyltransferase RlmM [Testudinibacter aquarius]KAE9526408.1 23S rRNA (cytidine(2498)-2'-O)-methyltransferase RlmM [Testudinibacter aquarius]TCV85704.1 23S rRNA (cytidine2498-2'-O)-methyltransferase [Testudinibacter aquarius]TNG91353.1 23S rRNA (cytidine(2498)-2'-O)-methyltransferase RlmM [Testudinibacter aquarius]